MAIPVWAALLTIKALGTGAGVAYSLYQRRQREAEADAHPAETSPPKTDQQAAKSPRKASKPKGPVLFDLGEEDS